MQSIALKGAQVAGHHYAESLSESGEEGVPVIGICYIVATHTHHGARIAPVSAALSKARLSRFHQGPTSG